MIVITIVIMVVIIINSHHNHQLPYAIFQPSRNIRNKKLEGHHCDSDDILEDYDEKQPGEPNVPELYIW